MVYNGKGGKRKVWAWPFYVITLIISVGPIVYGAINGNY